MFMPQLRANEMVKQYKPLVIAALIGYTVVNYQSFSRLAGFDPSNWTEYNYAKMIRQLRNVQIRQ